MMTVTDFAQVSARARPSALGRVSSLFGFSGGVGLANLPVFSGKRWMVSRVALVASLGLIMGLGPFERMPGGRILGPEISTPVAHWRFVSAARQCALEVRPSYPHSVTVNCWHLDGQLYIGCMACEGKTWSRYVQEVPMARVKILDAIYPVAMQRVSKVEEVAAAWEARWLNMGRELPAPAVPGGYWLYRVTSR